MRPASGDGAGPKRGAWLSDQHSPSSAPNRGSAPAAAPSRGRKGNNSRLHEPSSPVLRTLVVRASPVSKNPRGVAGVSFSRWLQRHLHESRRRDHPPRCLRNHRVASLDGRAHGPARRAPACRWNHDVADHLVVRATRARALLGPVVTSPPSSPTGPRPVSVAHRQNATSLVERPQPGRASRFV